jgi:hypothetical protein
MALPPLLLKIGAETADLDKTLGRVRKDLGELRGATGAVARGLDNFGNSAIGLGKSMLPLSAAVSGAAAGAFALANNVAKTGDEIAKSARAAGVGAGAMQELRFALGQAAGVGEQQTTTMLTRLTRNMGEAVEGNKLLANAITGLGISLEDVASGAVTTDQVFNQLVEAMQGAATDAEAAALGMQLLGRDGAALGPQLRQSGADIEALRDRAKELGIVLGEDALGASEEFNDKMDELGRQVGAAKAQIGMALMPVALALADSLQTKVVPAILAMSEKVAGAIKWFGELPAPVQEAAGMIATAIGIGGPALIAIGVFSKALVALTLASGPIGLVVGAVALLTAAWMTWGDDITRIVTETSDWITTKFEQVVDYFRSLPERFFAFGEMIMNGLRDGLIFVFENSILGQVTRIASGIKNTFKEALGIHSPSLVFFEYGQFIGEGLSQGINSMQPIVDASVNKLADSAIQSSQRMSQGVVASMNQMFQGSKPIAAAQALVSTYEGIASALRLPFPANIAAAAKTAAVGFNAVRQIKSARPGSGVGSGAASGASASDAGSGAQQQQQPVTNFRFTLTNDPMGFGESFARQMVEQINEAQSNGGRVRASFG